MSGHTITLKRGTTFSTSGHNHKTSDVTSLNGYSKATSKAALGTSDSLNTALGKLEYKVDLGVSAYDWYKSVTDTDTDTVINKWGEIVDFIDSVSEGTDILDLFVAKSTATNKGSATNPIYFDSNGVPQACSYSLNATVPSGAKFTDTTYSDATTTAAGLMSASDKAKLDGIATGANNYTYTLPTASSSVLGGIKVGTNLSIDSSGILSAKDTTYSAASTSAAGLMSAADKSKLDGIAAGANAYSLPIASSSALGGIKVGTNLSINSSGVLSATDTTYSAAT